MKQYHWDPVMPKPWNLVTVFRLVLLTELLNAKFSPGQTDHHFLLGLRWPLDGLYFLLLCLQVPGWLPSSFFFFSLMIPWTYRLGKEIQKLSSATRLLWDTLLSLTWLHICDYWERIYDFKGHILCSFCSTDWAPLFYILQPQLKEGAFVGMMPIHGG